MGLRLEAILGIVHNNKDISMTALAKRYVGFTLGETGFFEPKHEWANYKILEAYSFADVDEVIFKRIVIDILFILEGNRFLPIDFETDPLREGHTRKYIDNLSMIMANLEVLTKREIESKFYPDVKFHVVAGHRVKGEYELITKNTALGPIGTVFFLKDVDKEKKFSEILMKYRVCNILTVPDLSHLVILPMCGKELRFNRDFLKKSIELIQDFANKSISSPEVTEQCNWYKNLLFSTYSKMLTAEEWKEAYQVKDFTTIADAFVDYGKQQGREEAIEKGIEKGIEIGREKGREENRNETSSKLKELLNSGKSLTDPECLQVMGLSKDDIVTTPDKKM